MAPITGVSRARKDLIRKMFTGQADFSSVSFAIGRTTSHHEKHECLMTGTFRIESLRFRLSPVRFVTEHSRSSWPRGRKDNQFVIY
jgi:hypothetical protein